MKKGVDWNEVTNTTFQFTFAPVLGAKVLVTYVRETAGPAFTNQFRFNETPGGVVDGVNQTFTTSLQYTAGTLMVYLDGLRMERGVDWFEVNSTTFQFTFVPVIGSRPYVDYVKLAP